MLIKSLLSALLTGICLGPVWLFLFVQHMAEPNGFWQNLAIYGIGFFFLTGAQILLAAILLGCLYCIWFIWDIKNGF